MLDRPSPIENRLRDIDETLDAILARLTALERRAGPEAAAANLGDSGGASAAARAPSGASRAWLGFAGRTFIVLAGAFLLRALTAAGVLQPGAGAWLGVLYAAVWLVAADRSRGASAHFHGLAALIIALPLIVESAARFRFFTPADGVFALGAIAATTLVVGWHRRMPGLVAVALGGSLVAAVVLAVSTGHFPAFAALVVCIGITSVWMGYDREWGWAAWPAAIVADLAVTAVAYRAASDPPIDPPAGALALIGAMVLAYLGSFALRSLFHERAIGVFEVAQTAAVTTIGLAGAVTVARANGFDLRFVAVPSLFAGVVTYVQAYARVRPRRGTGPDLSYYLSLGFVFLLAGAALLSPAGMHPAIFGAAAVAACLAGWRLQDPITLVHGTLAALLAAATGGAFGFAMRAWTGTAATSAGPPLAVWVALAALVACSVVPPATGKSPDTAARVLTGARWVASGAVVWIGSSILVHLIARASLLGADPGWMATAKTVVLASAIVLLAAGRRTHRLEAISWLTYPALTLGLVKLLVEDFALASPTLLVVSLMAYGAALTIAARLMKLTATPGTGGSP